MPRYLLDVAEELFRAQEHLDEQDPSGIARRRKSISACYYSVFQATAHLLVSAFTPNSSAVVAVTLRPQIFRSLDHNRVVKVASVVKKLGDEKRKKGTILADPLEIWAENIVVLQQARHQADYDLFYEPSPVQTRSMLNLAKATLLALDELTPHDRTTLAVNLAFPLRTNT